MFSLARFLLPLVILSLATACASDRSFGTDPEIEITDLKELPPPSGQLQYHIGAQETLDISVAGASDLSGKFLTDENGGLSYPLLGTLNIHGLSPTGAAKLIEDGLRGRYLIDPQVRIIPENFPTPAISVGGQVNRPGSYPALGQPTLLRIVNQAQGLTEYAEVEDVLVIRTVNGQRYIGLYNVGAIQRGNYPDPQLYPNDIVTVGDSPARRRLETILQFLPLLSTAAIVIDRVGR